MDGRARRGRRGFWEVVPPPRAPEPSSEEHLSAVSFLVLILLLIIIFHTIIADLEGATREPYAGCVDFGRARSPLQAVALAEAFVKTPQPGRLA